MSYFSVVFETEANGAVSAFVPGLPVYAAADSRAEAEAAIRDLLAAYCEAHPDAKPSADVRVARVESRPRQAPQVTLIGAAALMGMATSRRKRSSSRANGRLGGRPRKATA